VVYNGEATGSSDWKNTCTQSIRSEYFSRSVVTGRNCKLGIEQSKIEKIIRFETIIYHHYFSTIVSCNDSTEETNSKITSTVKKIAKDSDFGFNLQTST
jgi:hypothetical protein